MGSNPKLTRTTEPSTIDSARTDYGKEWSAKWKNKQANSRSERRGTNTSLNSIGSRNWRLIWESNRSWEMECWGGPWTPTREGFEIIENWNLSNRKIQLLNRASGPIILIDYLSQGTHCSTLAHEIGHRLCHITEFRNDEEDAPLTPAMYRLFPNDTYMHKNGQKEFRAECFAEYLTKIDLRNSVERYCDAVLRRLRLKDRNVLSLIEHHRNNLAKY